MPPPDAYAGPRARRHRIRPPRLRRRDRDRLGQRTDRQLHVALGEATRVERHGLESRRRKAGQGRLQRVGASGNATDGKAAVAVGDPVRDGAFAVEQFDRHTWQRRARRVTGHAGDPSRAGDESGAVGLGHERRASSQRDGGTRDEQRQRQRLPESLRGTGHERQFDVGPVGGAHVVHHRPALQQRSPVTRRRKHQPVGRLPDRGLSDIAHEKLPGPGARRGDDHAPRAARSVGGGDGEVAAEILPPIRIGDSNPSGGVHRQGDEVAPVGDQADLVALDRRIAGLAHAALGVQQSADHDGAGGAAHFDP